MEHLLTYFISLIICLNLTSINGAEISMNIDCYDQRGSIPIEKGPGYESNATCTRSGYFATGCSSKNERIQGIGITLGAFWEGDVHTACIAFGLDSNTNNIAYARCCNLTDYDQSYEVFTSSQSGSDNYERISSKCKSDEELVGCSGDSAAEEYSDRFDGMFSGNISYRFEPPQPSQTDNICTAQNGNDGNGVWAEALCYKTKTINDSYNLRCSTVWAPQTTSLQSTVSCAPNKFMTSCSAYINASLPSMARIRSYYIEDNQCKAISDGFGQEFATANAICCSMTKTVPDPPTSTPSKTPTIIPTTYTIFPSSNPSLSPSLNPTDIPSKYPTEHPNASPSFNPTNNPSITPSETPSKYPIRNPSNQPSIMPTFNPINNPSGTHTKEPTNTPTKNPSGNYSTVLTTFVTDKTVPITSDYIMDKNSKHSNKFADSIPFFVILLCLLCCCICVCMTVCICRCMKRSEKPIYKIGSVHSPVPSMSVNNKKDTISLQMSKVGSVSENMGYNNKGSMEGTDIIQMTNGNNTPGSNILSDEFIIHGDDETMTPIGGNNNGENVLTNKPSDDEGTGDEQLNIDDDFVIEGDEKLTSEGIDAN